jgi:putative addiction module killer protein
VGRGISELRIDYGPGYRIYFQERQPDRAILLIGGTKKTQAWDIRRAYQLVEDG